MTFAAGRLRHTVVIRREVQVQNAKGGYDTSWQTVASPKAKVEGLDGRESMLAHALQGISSYRVTIRWRTGIKVSDQLVLPDGTELNIASANDPTGKREKLVILADTGSVRAEA